MIYFLSFAHQNPVCICVLPHMCHMPHSSHLPSFDQPINTKNSGSYCCNLMLKCSTLDTLLIKDFASRGCILKSDIKFYLMSDFKTQQEFAVYIPGRRQRHLNDCSFLITIICVLKRLVQRLFCYFLLAIFSIHPHLHVLQTAACPGTLC